MWCAGPMSAAQYITWRADASRQDYAAVCLACFERWRLDGIIRERGGAHG
jgi:hypothetical protein